MLVRAIRGPLTGVFFFFNAPATTEIYTLSLHDALPICLDPLEGPGVRIEHARVIQPELRRDDGQDARIVSAADRKSTRLNSSHSQISYAVFCLKKKKTNKSTRRAPRHELATTRHATPPV